MRILEREENLSLLEGLHGAYNVQLESFEGPLDLLLHLIRKNELDVRDIPIATITRQYLDYIQLMKELNLEIAGDFLLMASTLLHIKSRMLLPQQDDEEHDEDDGDPRAELIRRLMEYQQYKEAGMLIGARALLGREVFKRPDTGEANCDVPGHEDPVELDLFSLVDAFKDLLARIPVESFHEVAPAETFSIADSINEILALLQERDMVSFDVLVSEEQTRERVIVSFLAILELCRLKLIRIFQHGDMGNIWFVPAVGHDGGETMAEPEN